MVAMELFPVVFAALDRKRSAGAYIQDSLGW